MLRLQIYVFKGYNYSESAAMVQKVRLSIKIRVNSERRRNSVWAADTERHETAQSS